MNLFTRAILKLISNPAINMHKAYKLVRNLEKLIPITHREKYKFMDRKFYSSDGTHEIPVRVFMPKQQKSDEILLFFHGGGWVTGSIDSYTSDCIKLAEFTGRVVLSVDYLKAPENPYPAGFEDCYLVSKNLIEQLGLGGLFGATEISLMGNSAGGNLAAAISLRLRDEGQTLPAKQILINPVTYWTHDERSPFRSVEENGHDYGLTAKKMVEYMEMYEPDEAQRKSAYVSPLMADDFSKQPDSLIITSEFDPLRDEAEVYGHLLSQAGNQVDIIRANDTVHNYIFGPIHDKKVEESYQIIKDFLDGKLKGSVKDGEPEIFQ